MTLLHAHAHYICIVYAKYKEASDKALVQVISSSKPKHNPCLKGNGKKWLSSQSYYRGGSRILDRVFKLAEGGSICAV